MSAALLPVKKVTATFSAKEDSLEKVAATFHYSALATIWRDGEPAGVVVRMRQAAALRFFIPNPFIPEASRAYAVA